MPVVHRKIIDLFPTGAPKPVPLNAAVQADNTLYISGNIGVNKRTGQLATEEIEGQTRQALENMGETLRAAGTDHSKVVKCVCLLDNYADFAKFNAVYKTYFPKNEPARMCFEVSKLPLNAKVEIDAVAIVGDVVDVKAKL